MGMDDFLPYFMYVCHFLLAFAILKIFTGKLSNRDGLIVFWYIYVVIIDITQFAVYILTIASAGPLRDQASFFTAALRAAAAIDSRWFNDDPTVWSTAFFGAFIESFLSIALIRSIVNRDEGRNFLETALPVAQLVNVFHTFAPEIYAGCRNLSILPVVSFALYLLSCTLYVVLPVWILTSARGVKNGSGSSGGSQSSSPRGRRSRSR